MSEWLCACGHKPHNVGGLGQCPECDCMDWSEYDERYDGDQNATHH